MDTKWMIQQISTKIIKPSIPTPSHLKTYNVSLLDQLTIATYIPIALFYTKKDPPNHHFIPQILEKSLSQLLTSYYPFAGTLLPDGNSVECDDKGVPFSEVVIRCPMSEFIEETNVRLHDFVFSNNIAWGDSWPEEYLLYVQLTYFECGGKALSFRISHRVADGCSLTKLLTDWAAINAALLLTDGVQPVDHERPSPQFIGASLIPPIIDRASPSYSGQRHGAVVCKRFTFNAKSLAQLRALIAAEDDDPLPTSPESKPQYITRVELVTALLFKCAVVAAAKESNQLQGSTLLIKPSNLLQVANLRRMTTPQLGPEVMGNFYTYMDLVVEDDEGQLKLSRLIKELKKEKLEVHERMKKYYNGTTKNDLTEPVLENDEKMADRLEKDVYLCSSFCGYPLYEIDFGFGQPIWTILGSVYTENVFFLMDNLEGDGVEAMVTLEEKVMPVFENQEEIRKFASST